MKDWDPTGQVGPKKPLPDSVRIDDPPLDKIVSEPSSESREPVVVSAAPPAAEEPAYAQEPAYQADPYAEQPAF
jgi:small subunit ribosomal protein S3e